MGHFGIDWDRVRCRVRNSSNAENFVRAISPILLYSLFGRLFIGQQGSAGRWRGQESWSMFFIIAAWQMTFRSTFSMFKEITGHELISCVLRFLAYFLRNFVYFFGHGPFFSPKSWSCIFFWGNLTYYTTTRWKNGIAL